MARQHGFDDSPRVTRPARHRRLCAVATLAAMLTLTGCSSTSTNGDPGPSPSTSPGANAGQSPAAGSGADATTGSGATLPGGKTSGSATPRPAPTATVKPAAWFASANKACSLAIAEYKVWKRDSGQDPISLQIGAAQALTNAATRFDQLPGTTSASAREMQSAVSALAQAYRDAADAGGKGNMDDYDKAMKASDAAAAKIRTAVGSAAPACTAMLKDV